MTLISKKKSFDAATLLPTPSPSPPVDSHHRSQSPKAPRRCYTEAERRAHLVLARHCADQIRILHLANGAQRQQGRNTGASLRYQVEIERIEGEQKVMKRVAVIFPRANREGFKQHQLGSSLALIPPPRLGLAPSSPEKPSLFPYTSPNRTRSQPRRQSLPSLRSLSLLPFSSSSSSSSRSAPPPFRARNKEIPASSTCSPSNTSTSTFTPIDDVPLTTSLPLKIPRPPSSRQVGAKINLETTSALLQRRKLALSLRYPSSPSSSLPDPDPDNNYNNKDKDKDKDNDKDGLNPPLLVRPSASLAIKKSQPSKRKREPPASAEGEEEEEEEEEEVYGREDRLVSKISRWKRQIRESATTTTRRRKMGFVNFTFESVLGYTLVLSLWYSSYHFKPFSLSTGPLSSMFTRPCSLWTR